MKKTVKTARPIFSSAALEQRFQKELTKFIKEMHESVSHWLLAEYGLYAPVILAQDAATPARLPANALQDVLQEYLGKWLEEMNVKAEDVAKRFVQSIDGDVRRRLGSALRDAAKTNISMRMTKDIEDVLKALIYEQTSLIKSIPQQYATEVEGIVMRSVRDGRNEGFLKDEIENRYNVTQKRAKTIARDQTNKATESITRKRAQSLGIKKGIWMHRGGSKNPRSSHVGMDGKEFLLSEGLYDPNEGRKILPGELINCNCTFKPVLPPMLGE